MCGSPSRSPHHSSLAAFHIPSCVGVSIPTLLCAVLVNVYGVCSVYRVLLCQVLYFCLLCSTAALFQQLFFLLSSTAGVIWSGAVGWLICRLLASISLLALHRYCAQCCCRAGRAVVEGLEEGPSCIPYTRSFHYQRPCPPQLDRQTFSFNTCRTQPGRVFNVCLARYTQARAHDAQQISGTHPFVFSPSYP